MKISIQQQGLSKGIDTVLDVVSSKSIVPIISNMLLEAEEDYLTLSATDLNISITTRVPASVIDPGKIMVSARKFAEIIRELPNAPIAIEVADSRITISCHTGIYTEETPQEDLSKEGIYSLMGISGDEFPNFPEYGSDEDIVVKPDAQDLKDMISKTIFAVSSDETRPVLGGVLWQIEENQMKMVATDGHRLAKVLRTLTQEGASPGTIEAIVPPKALNHLVKLISGGSDLTGVTLSKSFVIFDLDTTVLFSRVIEGPYPDFEQVIPKHNEKKLVVAKDVLIPAVKRVSILSSSQTHQIRMALENNSIELSAVSQEIGGEARETIVGKYSNERIEVGYNANYLLEILRKMDSDEVMFELDSPVTAGLIKPAEQPEGQDYLCLVMPLRLN